ncbi:MAG TPA: protein kinase [Anaerolineae bacterium]|nr:protein kinase [Anaerolineae bacterium]
MNIVEGQMLGKYRVLEPLGRGGMARVYRAYHPQLDRYVAIKVMRADLAEDEEFQARFRREAQAVATLRHPNVVQVYDFDTENDISYMVMELLEGDTLKTRLDDYRARGERMPWGEMVRVILDVLEGLAYAHSEGMIHRDIKPGNILLTKRGQAVVGDFGIAHIIGGTRYTVPNALMGTLQYMAPEQGLEGRSDARSDIYSLGIVLYEMLTQRRPFDADTPLAVLMKHVNDPLPLPRQISPDIPEPLERVALKSLAKKPEDRYQGAAEMMRALRAAAEEAQITLPAHVSLPLSFTTTEAPAESVAVISGTTRQLLADASFAEGETDVTSGRQLRPASPTPAAANGQELATAGKELLNAMGGVAGAALNRTTDALRKVTATAGGMVNQPPKASEPARGSVGRAFLIALGTIGFTNLLMLTFCAMFNRWRLFELGWPIELFLVSLGLSIIMYNAATIWLLIPGGIVFGTGVLLAYSSLTNRWEQWIFLWLLEVWVVALSVWGTIMLARNQEQKPALARQIAWLMGGASVALAGFVALLAILGRWAIPVALVAAGIAWLRYQTRKSKSSVKEE